MIHPLTFLKGAGLGAGMMYFFDPVVGNRRRALVRDQIVHACTVCNRQADATYRDASNRLQGATAEVGKAIRSSDQPLMERVQEGVTDVGRTLGIQGRDWSPTAKAAAMIGGAGLVASFLSKRDLAAIGFGLIGLSFAAKELVEQEQLRSTPRQTHGDEGRSQTQGQQAESHGRPSTTAAGSKSSQERSAQEKSSQEKAPVKNS